MGGGGGNSGGGVERVATKAAKTQIAAKQKAMSKSKVGKTPGMASLAGAYNLSQQQKGLDEGGYAVAVPGTSYAPQGQAYTQAPGMKSSRELAAQTGLAGSIGQYSATKPTGPSRFGYVGDVAGVVTEKEVFGQKVSTFTGKKGYSPTGEKMDETETGGKGGAPTPAPAPEAEEEAAPTSMAMLPGETPSQYRKRVRRYGGGTIVEGGGVLYK